MIFKTLLKISWQKRAKKRAICKNLQYSNGNKHSGHIDAPSDSKIDASSELNFNLRAKLLNSSIRR